MPSVVRPATGFRGGVCPALGSEAQPKGASMAQENVDIPIPGKIISVAVIAGQQVGEGDVLCILESMKMENPILCPVKGVVKEVKVSAGQFVSSGAVAFIIEY